MHIYFAVIAIFLFVGIGHGANYTGVMIAETISNSSDPNNESIRISSYGVVSNKNQPYANYTTTGPVVVTNNSNFDMFFSSRLANRHQLVGPRSPTVISIKERGIYLVSVNVRWNANVTGSREIVLRKNGVAMASSRIRATPDGQAAQGITTLMFCEKDDNLRVVVSQNSGGPLAIVATDQMTNLSIVKLW